MVFFLNPREREAVIITLEGGEGAGKTTANIEIIKRLTQLGLKVMPQLKEPGSTPRAELIRMALKNTIDTSFPLPVSVREGFDLENFAEQVKNDPLPNYARLNIQTVMGQLIPTGIKYGLLEYVLNGGFNGMPFDTYDKMSYKAMRFSQGDSKELNNLYELVSRLNEALASEQRQKTIAETVLAEHLKLEVFTPSQQAKLFLAARNLLYHNVVGPAMYREYSFDGKEHTLDTSLGEFDVLVNDRSCDSTTVYQGYASDPSRVAALREENREAMEGIAPDLTLYFDVDPEIGTARTLKSRGIIGQDFFDSKKLEYHTKVRDGYKSEVAFYASLPKDDPEYCRIIEVDAHPLPPEVADLAWAAINRRLGKKLERARQIRLKK